MSTEENKLTPELKKRFKEMLNAYPWTNRTADSVEETFSNLMFESYQLDRTDLFTREEVERIADGIREICASIALESKTDMDCRDNILQIDVNKLIKK